MIELAEKDKKSRKLNKAQKIEALIASFLTMALLIAVPVYAWFAYSNNAETMTKVKEPDNLDIRAGNFHPIINFDLNGINIEDMAEKNQAEYRVFSVSAGDYKIDYKLQLAYTTNIPFKYTLYSATWKQDVTEATALPTYVEYHPLNDPDTKSYYEIGAEITLTPLNADADNSGTYGRTIAKHDGTIYEKTYDGADDDPEIYAVPMYLQTGRITPTNKEENEHDYFVLKIEWDEDAANQGFTKWNKAENNKETDIICITASRYTN